MVTVRLMSIDQLRPARAGEPWTEEEDARFIDELRAGRRIKDIARLLKRSRSAIEDRLRWFIPLEKSAAIRSSERETWLRKALNSPGSGYDWREVIKRNYAAENRSYWTSADLAVMREGWQGRRPLPELASALGASEIEVALQLCRDGLAKSLQDVVDRLGATPGGTVEIRARMAVDRAAASVWLLVVDGIGRRISVFDKQRRHVSVHGSYEEAKQRLSRLLDTRQRGHGSITWSIVCRVLGEDTVGEERHGVIKTEAARVPASAS